jgi:hypothetical protein
VKSYRFCHFLGSRQTKSRLLQTLQTKNAAWGVCEFSNKLYVACSCSNIIQVFNSSPPFSQLEDIEIRGLTDPNDISVCVVTGQLYIADHDQCAIWRVNLISSKQNKFISIGCPPWSLSTKSSRLLITPFDGDALFIYRNDGVLLKYIKLPDYMNATHAVETTHNTYIVSHGSRLAGGTLQSEYESHESVSEIDINGRVVRTLNSQYKDTGSIQFDWAYYLAFADKNHVIFADLRKKRIVMSNEDLRFGRVIIKSLQGQPVRLCFCQRTGLIFVVYSNNICVYKISNEP